MRVAAGEVDVSCQVWPAYRSQGREVNGSTTNAALPPGGQMTKRWMVEWVGTARFVSRPTPGTNYRRPDSQAVRPGKFRIFGCSPCTAPVNFR